MEHANGNWTAANGNEVHDIPTRYDESGARIGDTASRICKVEYPFITTTREKPP